MVLPLMANAEPVKLKSGTMVAAQVVNTVTSANPHAQPQCIVLSDVEDKAGNVLIAAGTPIECSANIVKAKGAGKPGTIDLKCTSTQTVDGKHVPLSGGIQVVGRDKKGLALGLGLGTGFTILFPIGFFFCCIKGENAEIPASTILQNVRVQANTNVDIE